MPDFDNLRALAARDGVIRDDRGRVLPVPLDAADEEISSAMTALDAAEAQNLTYLRSVGGLGNQI